LRAESARSSLRRRRNFQNTNSAILHGTPVFFKLCAHRDVSDKNCIYAYSNDMKIILLFIFLHSMKVRFCTLCYIFSMRTKCTCILCPCKQSVKNILLSSSIINIELISDCQRSPPTYTFLRQRVADQVLCVSKHLVWQVLCMTSTLHSKHFWPHSSRTEPQKVEKFLSSDF
jgi:hypothetical protein